MASMTIRCNEEDKKAAAEVAEYYGFDLSSVTRAFWKQIGRTGRIPLTLGNELPSEESLASLKEAEEIAAENPTRGYESGKALIEAALSRHDKA